MKDTTVTLEQLKKAVSSFIHDREWGQFHTPKNLSMNIAIEAAELMEHFKWVESADSLKHLETVRSEVEDELADVLTALLAFAIQADIDVASAFEKKMALNLKRYPVEQSRGRAVKHTQLAKEREQNKD